MHSEILTAFWETSVPLLLQRTLLKSTSEDLWGQGNASSLQDETASRVGGDIQRESVISHTRTGSKL